MMNLSARLRIAFDANALGYLCEDAPLSRAAKLRLRRQVDDGTAQVVAGWPLVGELACMAQRNWERFKRQMRELRRLTKGRLLHHWSDRVPLEAKRAGLLRDIEAHLPAAASRLYFERALADPGFSRHEARVVKEAKAKYAAGETTAKADYWAEARRLDNASGGNVMREWTTLFAKSPDAVIDDWMVTRALRDFSEKWGFGSDESKWPLPRDVPSLRADVAYHIGRGYVVAFEAVGKAKKEIDGNDFFDNLHFVDAAYAHVLVTSDKGFRRIASHLGDSGIRLQDFASWATEYVRRR